MHFSKMPLKWKIFFKLKASQNNHFYATEVDKYINCSHKKKKKKDILETKLPKFCWDSRVQRPWLGIGFSPEVTWSCHSEVSLTASELQFSSVVQLCLTLCDPMNRSTPGLPVHHQLLEFTQTHVHRVSNAIQPSHHLSSSSLPAPNPSQYQVLFQWVNSSHEVAKVLEFQLQHQSFQWTPRTDLL